jgi:hypothetical protein
MYLSEKEYSDIHWLIIRDSQKEKKELLIVNTACLLQIRGRSSTRDFIGDIKSLHYAAVEKDQCRGRTMALTKTYGLGFEHIKVSVNNLSFLFLLNLVWLFYVTFN